MQKGKGGEKKNIRNLKLKNCDIEIKEKLHGIRCGWLKRDLMNWKMVLRDSQGVSKRK